MKHNFDYLTTNAKKASELDSIYFWLYACNELHEKFDKKEISSEEHVEAMLERSKIFDQNKAFFSETYGKQTFTYNDNSISLKHYVWAFSIEDKGLLYFDVSSKGTTIWVEIFKGVPEDTFLELFKFKIRTMFNLTLF